MRNNSPFGHETDGAQKACFHSLEIGLTQTPIWGVTHTYGRGVTQTDFEAVEGLEKKKRKKWERRTGRRDVRKKMLTFAAKPIKGI